MNISKICPYCGGRGYINQFENIDSGCRAWEKECIACKGTGSILYPETNADRIRRMSDEELAKQLYDIQKQLCVHFAKAVGFPVEELQFQESAPDILDWLQQPAEEDA